MIKRLLWLRESSVALLSGTTHQSSGPRRSRAVATGLWIVAVLACLLGAYPLFAALAQLGPSISDDTIEDFNAGYVSRPVRLIAVDGFSSGDQGWYLDPGTSGRLVYRVPIKAGSRIGLDLWMYSPAGVSSRVVAHVAGAA